MRSAASMSAHPFEIRRVSSQDSSTLFDIWLRSVSATHTFLNRHEIDQLAPDVEALGLASLDTWGLYAPSAGLVGFMLMNEAAIEALFIAPEWLRRGGGRLLIEHARSLRGPLSVEVNEQNAAAVEFYLANGFRIVGRSPTDHAGRPYPLLHMRETPQPTS